MRNKRVVGRGMIVGTTFLIVALGLMIQGVAQGSPTLSGCPVLPSNNIWNAPVDTMPLDPNSDKYIATIGTNKLVHPDFGSGIWDDGPIGIPYNVVPGSQPKVVISFDYADESDPGPYPIPPNPAIEGGNESSGDRHVLVLDRDHCVLYETWSTYPQSDGSWYAGSGAIFDLRSNALRPSTWTSSDAAGLPVLPGLVRYDEVAAGEITHAIRFTAPHTRREFIWPARHYASSLTDQEYPPMGQRFRLKASFNISGFAPEVQVILRGLKKYGMILADNGSSWFLSGAPDSRWNDDILVNQLKLVNGSDFEAIDESSLMVDPDSGEARSGSSTFNPNPPDQPVRLIFIHHSTGQNWLADDNGRLGIALRDNNYYVSDTNYGWGPDGIGDLTDIGDWWLWFRGTDSGTYLGALYDESDQHASYSRMAGDPPGDENEVILFKSCFPNSALQGNASDPIPPIDQNPLRGQNSSSRYHTVANAKGIYTDILEYFRTRQDKLFIAITAPPLSDETYSANARALNQWLVNDWLKDYPYDNVAVFDFYNLLTTNGGSPDINDLGQESGNHHRWWQNAIQHKVDGDNNDGNPNILEYPSGDDHPSTAGNLKATGEFPALVNIFYHCWKGTGACPGAPSQQQPVISGTVRYYSSNEKLVQGVQMSLDGSHDDAWISDSNGNYVLADVVPGNHELTPAKSDDVGNVITAMDASFVLQGVVGLIELSPYQKIAADTNCNSKVTAMDASYILQKVVGLIELPFAGCSKIWTFDPLERSYAPLSSDQSGQNFKGIVVGDVNGNWMPPVQTSTGKAQAAAPAGPARTKAAKSPVSLKGTAALSIGKAVRISEDHVSVPVMVTVKKGQLFSAELALDYAKSSFEAVAVHTGSLFKDAMLASNLEKPGKITIGLASSSAIKGSGELVSVVFKQKKAKAGLPRMLIREASLNDGQMTAAYQCERQN